MSHEKLKTLHLFAGAGGGLLADLILGHEPIGYVEINEHCQKVIAQRIKDGILPNAPIFGDIRAFISEGFTESYQGMVDILAGGFPCQPFSVAGKGLGESDERNMWPETMECIRKIRPSFCLLENVPGLLNHEYIRRIFGDLAAQGYDCRWDSLSGKSMGAPIKRERIFITCSDKIHGEKGMGTFKKRPSALWKNIDRKCPDFWLQAPPRNLGVGNGVADYLERVEAIGNGQIPIVVASAWAKLIEACI